VPDAETPAQAASRVALEAVYACLESGESFRLEAGAGAGKTYSLVKALGWLVQKRSRVLARRGQKVACITFTNVAKDEIEARTDRHPAVFCETNHAFCWSLINGLQAHLRTYITELPAWQDRLAEAGGIGGRTVEYTLGHRSIRDGVLSLHHDDILPLTIRFMENAKFRKRMAELYPVILVDEYQDTDADWMEAIKAHFLGVAGAPQFGFFGDHWQKIYGDGCGKLEHPAVKEIGKEANFRSVQVVVDCLNRMRPELPQFVNDPTAAGSVRVFHSNGWVGQRQGGAHWGGDLPVPVAHQALDTVKTRLVADGWRFDASRTKVLMLTHRVLAAEQGYASLPGVFQFNDAFTKKENPHIAFLVDVLEPACDAFAARRFGEMFDVLGTAPHLRRTADKAAWAASFQALDQLRANGAVGEVIGHLMQARRPRLPDAVADRERDLRAFDPGAGQPMPRYLTETQALHGIQYAEIKALRAYLAGHSPFETKHGVKGQEFENVLVVIGRGWNQYNFGEMLELAVNGVPAARAEMFERNRNLFYVACSRPMKRLALLFTQQLSPAAMGKVQAWFGDVNVEGIAI
jgi:DNA helicase-2/ATP-dependent DNA helicase PcrA